MSHSTRDAVVLLLGAAALAYVVHAESPARSRVAWTALVAAGLIALYLVAWPHLAPQAGPIRLTEVAVWWLPVWSALLHDSTEDDEERGPWALALLPLLLVALLYAATRFR